MTLPAAKHGLNSKPWPVHGIILQCHEACGLDFSISDSMPLDK
jgi:hypothetical protein